MSAMLMLSLFICFLRVGTIVGFVAPFSTRSGVANRNAKTPFLHNDKGCARRYRDYSNRISRNNEMPCWRHSTPRRSTAFFTFPTDEELFLSLFREKEEQKEAGIPKTADVTSSDVDGPQESLRWTEFSLTQQQQPPPRSRDANIVVKYLVAGYRSPYARLLFFILVVEVSFGYLLRNYH